MTNWSEYAYQSNDGGMIILLLLLGAIMIYLLFSKGFWLDRFMQNNKDAGEPLIHQDDTGVPHITSPTNKPKKKRKYKKRGKKK